MNIPQLQAPFGQREPMQPGTVVPLSVTSPPPQVTYAPVPPPLVMSAPPQAPPEASVQYDLAAIWAGLDPQQQATLRHGLEAGATDAEIAQYVPVQAAVVAQMRLAWAPQPAQPSAPPPQPAQSVAPQAVASVLRVTKKHRDHVAQLHAQNVGVETIAQQTGLTLAQVAKEIDKLGKAEGLRRQIDAAVDAVADLLTHPGAPPQAEAAGRALELQVGMILTGTPDVVPLEAEMLHARGLALSWAGTGWLVGVAPQSVAAAVAQHVDTASLTIEEGGQTYKLHVGLCLDDAPPDWFAQRAAQKGFGFQKRLDGRWEVVTIRPAHTDKPPITPATVVPMPGVQALPMSAAWVAHHAAATPALLDEITALGEAQTLDPTPENIEARTAFLERTTDAFLERTTENLAGPRAATVRVLHLLCYHDLPAGKALLAFSELVDGLKDGRYSVEALDKSLTELLNL